MERYFLVFYKQEIYTYDRGEFIISFDSEIIKTENVFPSIQTMKNEINTIDEYRAKSTVEITGMIELSQQDLIDFQN